MHVKNAFKAEYQQMLKSRLNYQYFSVSLVLVFTCSTSFHATLKHDILPSNVKVNSSSPTIIQVHTMISGHIQLHMVLVFVFVFHILFTMLTSSSMGVFSSNTSMSLFHKPKLNNLCLRLCL